MTTWAPIVIQVLVILLFVAGVASFALLLKGCFVLRRMARTRRLWDPAPLLRSPLVPGVSVIAVPADVSPESREFIRRLLDLHFGNLELVVVLDGPSETELTTWCREFRLGLLARDAVEDLPTAGILAVYQSREPYRLTVVAKESGGRADALNAGVNLASLPTIGLIDPASSFEPTILLRLALPMLEETDIAAVCGSAPEPTPGGLAANLAALESLRAWMVRCAAFSGWNAAVPTPGAALLIRREAILKAGGFRTGPLELVLRLHGTPQRVVYLQEDVHYAAPPRSLRELFRRTVREQAEIALVWRALPALFCDRFLRPTVETAAYVLAAAAWLNGWIDTALAGLVLATTSGMGIVVSMGAIALRELGQFQGSSPALLLRLFIAVIPENLGYRQVRNLWLIAGFLKKKEARARAA